MVLLLPLLLLHTFVFLVINDTRASGLCWSVVRDGITVLELRYRALATFKCDVGCRFLIHVFKWERTYLLLASRGIFVNNEHHFNVGDRNKRDTIEKEVKVPLLEDVVILCISNPGWCCQILASYLTLSERSQNQYYKPVAFLHPSVKPFCKGNQGPHPIHYSCTRISQNKPNQRNERPCLR